MAKSKSKAEAKAPAKPKKYTKDELKELSKEVFKHNEEVDKLYATTDGKFFTEKNYAEAHAWSLAEGDREVEVILTENGQKEESTPETE